MAAIARQVSRQRPSLHVNPRLFALTLLSVVAFGSTAAQSPVIHRTIPLAIQPGQPTSIQFVGENLSGITDVWNSFAARPVRIPTESSKAKKNVSFEFSFPADELPGLGAVRLVGTNGISDLHWILLDPLPATANAETNTTLAAAQNLIIPSAVDGLAAEVTLALFPVRS
jgi:hypothetical protein